MTALLVKNAQPIVFDTDTVHVGYNQCHDPPHHVENWSPARSKIQRSDALQVQKAIKSKDLKVRYLYYSCVNGQTLTWLT